MRSCARKWNLKRFISRMKPCWIFRNNGSPSIIRSLPYTVNWKTKHVRPCSFPCRRGCPVSRAEPVAHSMTAIGSIGRSRWRFSLLSMVAETKIWRGRYSRTRVRFLVASSIVRLSPRECRAISIHCTFAERHSLFVNFFLSFIGINFLHADGQWFSFTLFFQRSTNFL